MPRRSVWRGWRNAKERQRIWRIRCQARSVLKGAAHVAQEALVRRRCAWRALRNAAKKKRALLWRVRCVMCPWLAMSRRCVGVRGGVSGERGVMEREEMMLQRVLRRGTSAKRNGRRRLRSASARLKKPRQKHQIIDSVNRNCMWAVVVSRAARAHYIPPLDSLEAS